MKIRPSFEVLLPVKGFRWIQQLLGLLDRIHSASFRFLLVSDILRRTEIIFGEPIFTASEDLQRGPEMREIRFYNCNFHPERIKKKKPAMNSAENRNILRVLKYAVT